MSDFKVGDTVQLKGSFRTMVVNEVVGDGSSNRYVCIWYDPQREAPRKNSDFEKDPSIHSYTFNGFCLESIIADDVIVSRSMKYLS